MSEVGAARPSLLRRLLFWGTLVLALGALGTGVAVAYEGYRGTTTPTGVVRAFFTALERDDARAALGYSVLPDGDRRLLTDDTLSRQQADAPISDVRVGPARTQAGRGTVAVSYRLDAPAGVRRIQDVVPVTRTGAGWRVARPAASVSGGENDGGQYARLAGYAVGQRPVLVFPGALPVSYVTPYLALDPDSSVARLKDQAGLTLNTVPSPAGRSALTSGLISLTGRCLTAATPDPLCPVLSEVMVPGSLRGGTVGSDVDNLQLSFDANGAVHVSGSVHLTNTSYRELNPDNQPVLHRGDIDVVVYAAGYPLAPLHLQWEAPS